jgi:hypothetical protein
VTDGSALSIEELRAIARRRGIEPDDADLAGVRDFLAVFLPAIDDLSRLLPDRVDAPGPQPLDDR